MVSTRAPVVVISVWGYALILSGFLGLVTIRDLSSEAVISPIILFLLGFLQVKRGWFLSYWAGLAACLSTPILGRLGIFYAWVFLISAAGWVSKHVSGPWDAVSLIPGLLSVFYPATMAFLFLLALISYIALFPHRKEFFEGKPFVGVAATGPGKAGLVLTTWGLVLVFLGVLYPLRTKIDPWTCLPVFLFVLTGFLQVWRSLRVGFYLGFCLALIFPFLTDSFPLHFFWSFLSFTGFDEAWGIFFLADCLDTVLTLLWLTVLVAYLYIWLTGRKNKYFGPKAFKTPRKSVFIALTIIFLTFSTIMVVVAIAVSSSLDLGRHATIGDEMQWDTDHWSQTIKTTFPTETGLRQVFFEYHLFARESGLPPSW